MQCGCAGGFCSVLLVWNLSGGPHESGYIYLLPQSPPLAQCSTATTCTTQTPLCCVPLWTEDMWGALWHMNPLFFFQLAKAGIEPGTFSMKGRLSTTELSPHGVTYDGNPGWEVEPWEFATARLKFVQVGGRRNKQVKKKKNLGRKHKTSRPTTGCLIGANPRVLMRHRTKSK